MEIYDAEATAINNALKAAITYATEHNVTHIHVFVDNQAAVRTVFDVVPGLSQHVNLHTCSLIVSFLKSSNQHHIEVTWTPGHKKIMGNERADALAKAATEIVVDTPPNLPLPQESTVSPAPYHILDNRVAQTAPAPKRIPTSQQVHTSPETPGTFYPHTPQPVWLPHPVPHRTRIYG